MPKPPKKMKPRPSRAPSGETPYEGGNEGPAATAAAVAEPPAEEFPKSPEMETPRREQSPRGASERDEAAKTKTDKDHIATSLNIAKLQGMSMTDLNQMAREFSVSNFGTMRKHEVIFHILQKNAE